MTNRLFAFIFLLVQQSTFSSFSAARKLGEPAVTDEVTADSKAVVMTAQRGPAHLNMALIELFRLEKERRKPSIIDKQYRTCMDDFVPFAEGPLTNDYQKLSPSQQREIAEYFWIRQEGNLWMQHSRKAGGTSLCMHLHLNEKGLMKPKDENWAMPLHETCQVYEFCRDCDLTVRKENDPMGKFPGWDGMPHLMNCVLNANQRNFNEIEGTVSPPNILTQMEWANYVFISTIRHPISRIISSLHRDRPYRIGECHKVEDGSTALNNCAHTVLATDNNIMSKCHAGIYFCYSNYYVRMFAGHTNDAEHVVTRDTLEAAKNNFLRYSCVVLQERYHETDFCLSSRLGLHLASQDVFNAGENTPRTNVRNVNTDEIFLKSVSQEELQRLKVLNALDLEFFEWASEIILSGYFTGYKIDG